MYELLDRVVRVQHVRGCIVFAEAGQPIADRTSGASAEMRAAVRLLVEQMNREGTDEARRELANYKLFGRRIGAVVCGVIAAREVDELSLRMQLNILAIKLSAVRTSERTMRASTQVLPSNAVQALERELISDVGPLGKVLFEAALKRMRSTPSTLSPETARELTSYLAGEIPERSRRSWLSRSSAIIEAATVGLPRPLSPLVRAESTPVSGVRTTSSIESTNRTGGRRTA